MDKIMNVLIAIDSFKGSMSSIDAGEAAAQGIRRVNNNAKIKILPLADGGEGTVLTLVTGMNGRLQRVNVTGPCGEKIDAYYGLLEHGHTAVIEMSAAAGITLVPEHKRNPLYTTTYGVGEMILHAVKAGCRNFIIGIGGSATNDGGIGMLQALGYGFQDANGHNVVMGAKGLEYLSHITTEHVLPELKECTFQIACDVNNILCGDNGCSAVYGPQKGATSQMIEQMDRWLSDYAALAIQLFPQSDPNKAGAGAAGGMGFAFQTFLDARLESGIDIILREIGFEHYIREADVVITGEGRLDGQTVRGKAPVGVAKLAKKYGKMVLAFSGCVTKDASICNENGIDAYFPILRNVSSLEEALDVEVAKSNMTDTVEQVFRVLKLLS